MEFVCIADRCKHSCCIGWEIDIDEDTFLLYQELPGTFGDFVRSKIATEEDGTHHFILEENERCPFLNESNLCELILNLGEEALCDICREHPRFYVEDEGDYRMGYGLCCEEAGRLCLFDENPSSDETVFVCEELRGFPSFQSTQDWMDFIDMLQGLEQLGTDWAKWLSKMTECFQNGDGASVLSDTENVYDNFLKKPLTHFYDYLMFRYNDVIYSRIIWQLLYGMCLFQSYMKERLASACLTPEDVIEICRVYSSEIEYCEENVEAIKLYAINGTFGDGEIISEDGEIISGDGETL